MVSVDRDVRERLPDHLVGIPGHEWALWRTVGLRGAGFPASQPSLLAAPNSAALADLLLEFEATAEQARIQAVDLLRRDLQSAAQGDRAAIAETIRRLGNAELSRPLDPRLPSADGRVQELRSAILRLISARESFRREFQRETAVVSDALCRIAASDRFREAVLWQNRRAVHTGIDPLLRNWRCDSSRGSKQRQHEEMVASYLQRYCLKNDTIGFFGPVGWATLADDGAAVVARPGKQLLAERKVYFEVWCIDALAETLARDRRLEPWLAPRLAHLAHVENGALLLPGAAPAPLPPAEAALLLSCDGEKTVRQIALDLTRETATGVRDEQEVLAHLRDLRDRGLVSLTLAVPMELRPEETLGRLLQRIGDDDLRGQMVGALDELRQARDGVAGAAGRVDELDRALDSLEHSFTRLTDRLPTRSPGETYAARTLVYEDCRRDIEVSIGPEIIDALGPPLALLLAGARWLTFDIARRHLAALRELHRQIVRNAGSSQVDFATFWYRSQPLLFGERATLTDDAVAAFQQRWARLLDLPSDQRHVEYRCEQLRPRASSAFDAPKPGWQYARYHSPDVMISTRSLDDMRLGNYLLVLGELHVAANTLGWPLFMAAHPSPEDLLRAADHDLPDPRLEPVVPKSSWPGQTARLLPSLISGKDFRLELSADPSGAPSSQVLPLGSLVITDAGDRLVVRTRDRRLEFDLVDVLGHVLTQKAVSRFSLLPPRAHVPRVTFDRLVVARESWSFAPAELRFAWEKEEAERFLAVRRWARDHGLPRCVFVKAPIEAKPFYMDLDSPTYVNVFAKAVRRSTDAASTDRVLTLTEMLPQADEAWLMDAEGNRYTSEFRMVAVDLTPGFRTTGGRQGCETRESVM